MISVTCLANLAVFFQLLILFTVMLLIGFEPAFSGKILKKLDKELKKVNDPFFLSICIVIKSFSYIQMKYQTFDQDFFADIGKNAVDIQTIADEVDSNTVFSNYILILFVCIVIWHCCVFADSYGCVNANDV